jgi:PPOX class probable F420-dependent enzyme
MSAVEAVAGSPFVSLGTFRRSGEVVATPVWIARDGDELVVTTEVATGKVRRLRNDPRVTLRPCGRLGAVADDAPTMRGVCERIVPAAEDAAAARALGGKYGAQFRLVLGVERLVRRLQRRRGDRVILRIARLEDAADAPDQGAGPS